MIHEEILKNTSYTLGSVINGYRITKLDRDNKVVELEREAATVDLSGYVKRDDIPNAESLNLYSGSGIPANVIGADGDFYEDLSAKAGEFSIYGPKANGVWPAAAYRKIDDLSGLATKTALTTEADTRKSADDALQTKITDETTARITADTALDLRLVTAENLLGKKKEIRLNRSPTNTDVYEIGQVWADISFSEETPLRFVSLGGGAWEYISQITLTKIRFFANGRFSTYRSQLNQVKFFKPDGSQIPNNWFVWGAASGISGGPAGSTYTGQGISAGYNASGWVDIEVSGLFDMSVDIARIMGDFNHEGSFIGVFTVEFWYTNGSRKTYTATGYQKGAENVICDLSPAVICRYGDTLAAAQGEMLTAAKLSDPDDNDYGRTSGAANVGAFNRLLGPTLTLLNALKQVKAGFQTTVLVDGSILPVTPDFPAPSASGFTNDGDGDVAGATSWTNNAPIGVNIGQSGFPDDEYEISVAFGAANPSARISFQVDSVWQDYTAAGVQAGTLDLTEFNTGTWRGATLKVKGDFTGMVAFNTKGTTYIGPVIKRKRAKGYEVDGNALALLSDIPEPSTPPDLTSYALNTALGIETKLRTAADAALAIRLDELWKEYATQSWVNSQLDDINGMVNNIPHIIDSKLPASLDLTSYAKTVDLTDETKARQDSDTAINQVISNYNDILLQHQTEIAAETTARTEADTALDTRLDDLEAKRTQTKGLTTDFKTDSANNQVAQLWDAYTLSSALNPRQFADVNALLAFNTTGLQLYRHGYIKSTKESVYWDKDATAGDYKPNTGPGYWLKASQPVNEGQYFGTVENQAGDAGATNGGHTFTQRLFRGSGIATSNHSTFTLSGGIYRVRFGVTRHWAVNTWRSTGLLVNGVEVTHTFSGSDGGNWESGGDLEWIVDATTVNQTAQMRRMSSLNNGNINGWLAIEKIAPLVVTSGYQTRELCPITLTGATFSGGNTVNIPTGTGQFIKFDMAANLQLATVTGSVGLTVGTPDKINNCVWVAVADGTATGTLTVTTEAKTNPNQKTISVVKTVLQCSIAQKTYNVDVALQEGDKLLVTGDYDNDARSTWTGIYMALPGTSQRAWPWPSAADHSLLVIFPQTLASSFNVTHGLGNTSFRIRRVEVLR